MSSLHNEIPIMTLIGMHRVNILPPTLQSPANLLHGPGDGAAPVVVAVARNLLQPLHDTDAGLVVLHPRAVELHKRVCQAGEASRKLQEGTTQTLNHVSLH